MTLEELEAEYREQQQTPEEPSKVLTYPSDKAESKHIFYMTDEFGRTRRMTLNAYGKPVPVEPEWWESGMFWSD